MSVGGSSTVVEPSTTDPKIKGSNPAAARRQKKNGGGKNVGVKGNNSPAVWSLSGATTFSITTLSIRAYMRHSAHKRHTA